MKRNIVRLLVFFFMMTVIPACTPALTEPTATPSPTLETAAATWVFVDCSWYGTAEAWLDVNSNGIWDADEVPLEGIRFFVEDALNDFPDANVSAVSDAQGRVELSVFLAGCPDVELEVFVQVPDQYQPTTPIRISADQLPRYDALLQFGFRYK